MFVESVAEALAAPHARQTDHEATLNVFAAERYEVQSESRHEVVFVREMAMTSSSGQDYQILTKDAFK